MKASPYSFVDNTESKSPVQQQIWVYWQHKVIEIAEGIQNSHKMTEWQAK